MSAGDGPGLLTTLFFYSGAAVCSDGSRPQCWDWVLGVWLGLARGRAMHPGDSPPHRGRAGEVDTLFIINDLWLNPDPKPLSLTMNDPYLFPKCT